MSTAFVLAGGGSLGAIQVGMLRALLEAGVTPDFIVGSSVGALNACYFAGNPNLDGVDQLAAIWTGLHRRDVFPFSVWSALSLVRRKSYLVDPEPLRRLIVANIPFELLDEATLPVHVVATDLQGDAVLASRGPAVEAVLASTAVPGVFPMVEREGTWLMDGAVASNTPVIHAAHLGASRIFVLPTGYACALKAPPSGFVARALHALTLLTAWQLVHDLERAPANVGVHLLPPLCPLDVSPYDFSQSRTLIERAETTTRRWIDKGGLERQASPMDLAPHHHD